MIATLFECGIAILLFNVKLTDRGRNRCIQAIEKLIFVKDSFKPAGLHVVDYCLAQL